MFLALVLPCALTAFATRVTLPDTEPASPATTAAAADAADAADAASPAASPTVNTPMESLSANIKPIEPLLSPIVVDTLPTENPDLKVVLFNDNTWRYVALRPAEQDSTVYDKCWDTNEILA